ncbi:GGDEF domain-containing protein [Marinomonas sp. A79]|uniref:diguanylate cyclase n=1 Tax=Marinomonas vulgaris TaxID=2823372 RepID=A0ABS5H8V7_9GAMM|nr:GGDEF domain-containing protein [Marinomonas vulgaris]MBR7887394.1 GGDEF domain-containing protein [Marinomonas vulgaris]
MSERLGSLFVPCCILLLSVYGSLYVGLLPPLWFSLLPFMPFILAGIAILLAWHFNKGRVLILVCLLLVPKLHGEFGQAASFTAYLVVSCCCIALLGLIPERGFFNRYAINRGLFISMLITWCYAIERGWVSFAFLDATFLYTSYTWSNVLLGAALLISVGTIGTAWWLSGDAFRASGLISILSLLIISHFASSSVQFDTLLSAQFLLWVWFLLLESHRMAYVDDMTKLPGRRALNEHLVGLPKEYALAMVDVDHFKKFNDTYGHDMGDKVLKNVAYQLMHFSGAGKAFRYGGEEFTVVFRGKGLAQAKETLDDLRINIEEALVEVFDPKKKQDIDVSVTVSIGVAFSSAGESPEVVLKRADDALYQSKKKGRNRVSTSPSPISS